MNIPAHQPNAWPPATACTRLVPLLAAGLLAACATAPSPRAPATATPHVVAPAPQAGPQSSSTLASPATQIDAFITQPRFAHADWGIDVVDLDSGATLYAHGAQKLFVPASNTKLYTAALALDALGSDARIATTLYATAAPDANGTLDGDLILYGRGDPSLGDAEASPDWAERMAAALATRGVRRMHGDLIADTTYFAGPEFGSGWEAGDLQTWYGAPVSALNAQGNRVRVRVARDSARCCTVAVDPANAGMRVVDLTGDVASSDSDTLGLYRPPGSDALYASGSLAAGVAEKHYALSAPDPALFAGTLLRDALTRQGIALDGRVRALHWPQRDPAMSQPGLQNIASIESPPLTDLIRHMLKHSDNLYAQALLLQVGARTAQRGACADRAEAPTTSEGWGLCALRALLARANIDPQLAAFVEGAGLSRQDLVAPAATVHLLAWSARQPWAGVLRDALPVAGVDGTLRHRLRDSVAADNLQAKTGTLSHAYALSGYVTDAAGAHLAFSLMLDHYQRPVDALGRDVPPSPSSDLDAIATMIADNDQR